MSTGLRAGPRRIVFALGNKRETLERLRKDPRAAFALLTENAAFTAYGQAHILKQELDCAPHVTAVELAVERIQDHLEGSRTEIVEAARWRWTEDSAREDEANILAELRTL